MVLVFAELFKLDRLGGTMKMLAVSRTWLALLAFILFTLVGGVGAAQAEEARFNPDSEIGPSLGRR